jgi:uncharacterized protein (TIGR03000 family)
MFKRGYAAAACGALALLLTAAQTSPAEVFVTFPVGRGGTLGAFGPRSIAFFPSSFGSPYYGSPYYGSPYYGSPYSSPLYGGYNPSYYPPDYGSYSVNTVTPIYYGASSLTPGYSTVYAPPRLVSPSPDLAAKITDAAAPASYATPTYPLRSPDYNVIYPISPPLSQLVDNTAKVEVRVAAGAELWFDGHATSLTGADRSFTTPALEPRQDYVYEVRAHWDANGKPVDQTRKVTVHAGDRVVVDFHRTDAAK